MIVTNIEKLITFNAHPGTRIISLDVFDTLLIRKVEPSSETKTIVSDYICNSKILSISSSDLLDLRIEKENSLSEKSKNEGFDSEFNLEEVYAGIVTELGESAEKKNLLVDCELQAEKALISPMPGIEQILQKLKNSYKLVAISDTYFPNWFLSELLKSARLIDYFDQIYCSCEYKLNKFSGNLYNKVIELEQISNDKLTHIGDNYFSDYFVPKSYGIESVLIFDSWNLKRRMFCNTLQNNQNKSAALKGYLNLYRINSADTQNTSDRNTVLYNWGKSVLGPLLTVFTHLLVDNLKENKTEKAFFIARDGFILKEIYDLFKANNINEQLPESKYIHLSRYTSFIASIIEIEKREIELAIYGSKIPPEDVLLRLGVKNVSKYFRYFEKYNIEPDQPIEKKRLYSVFKELILKPDLSKEILDNAYRMSGLLYKYLDQNEFFANQRTALVDIGWQGTIQNCIVHAYNSNTRFPNITGYYLGLNTPLFNEDHRNKTGLLYDYKNCSPEELYIYFFRDLLEISSRSNNGTTVDYTQCSNGKVEPVFAEYKEMDNYFNYIEPIQRGIIDFANEYIKLMQIFNFKASEQKDFIVNYYRENLCYPQKNIIEHLKLLANTGDFGSKDEFNLINDISIKDIFSLKSFLNLGKKTIWMEASLEKSNIPFINSVYNIYKRIRLHRAIKRTN